MTPQFSVAVPHTCGGFRWNYRGNSRPISCLQRSYAIKPYQKPLDRVGPPGATLGVDVEARLGLSTALTLAPLPP
jgi:hypothetical protein